MGIEAGVVEKKGAWLQFDGELIGQGKDAAQKALAEKPELAKKIVEAIMAKRNAAAPAVELADRHKAGEYRRCAGAVRGPAKWRNYLLAKWRLEFSINA